MRRALFSDLKQWAEDSARQPMVIRGARQVGKTWLVRHLAEAIGLQLIELNFERNKQYIDFFESNDPAQIMRGIYSMLNINTKPSQCLLFLDEIQVHPRLLTKLRWFSEEMPELAVIATGSLLDFALDDHEFSMPVGRIGYCYLEPFSFEEFLMAMDKNNLVDYIQNFDLHHELPGILHQQLLDLFGEYILVGGMPAAITRWKRQQLLPAVNQVHNTLLATYQDDFNKYRGRVPIDRLDEIIMSVPRQLSEKFVYKKANPDVPSSQLKPALHLLNKARICHRVASTHGNGLPLGAELKDRYFKQIFLDVGLCSAQLGLNLEHVFAAKDINLINKGGIAEQVVGQLLRTTFPFYIDPSLYCWMRADATSTAEIDYLIQHTNTIIPIEVKAGSTGSLKSLHYFMGKKQLHTALRINADTPSTVHVNMKNTTGEPVHYTLLSIPLYLTGQIHRLLKNVV